MALKIRLRQQGRRNRPFFRMVVTDGRTRRDGKYVEMIGWYNPFGQKDEEQFNLKTDRLQHWLSVGAVPSEQVESLCKKAAPDVVKEYKVKALEKRNKLRIKNKERRNKKREAVASE